MFLILLVGRLFLLFIGVQSFNHKIKVDFMPVKLRAIDTNELRHAVNIDSTAAAHPCPVNHNRVEGDLRRDAELLCDLAAEFHHYRRAYHKGLGRLLVAGANFFQRLG